MKLSKLFIFSLLVVFIACNEDELDPPTNLEFEYVKDESRVENSFEEAEELAFAAIFETSELGGRFEQDNRFDCAVITLKENSGVYSLTIDFGNGCIGPDDRVRKGIITVNHNGKIWEYDATISVEFTDFFIDDLNIEGKRSIINRTTSLQYIKHQITLENGKITWPDGTFLTRSADKMRSWVRGSEGFEDDVVTVEGNANGTNRLGKSYTMNITEPLVFKKDCRVDKIFIPVSGIKLIETDSKSITIDFGNGECDKTVTVTAGGSGKDIEING